MSRIYDRIKSLLPKKASNENPDTGEQSKHSEEELETICKSKSLLQKTQDSIKEVLLLCMEPFI